MPNDTHLSDTERAYPAEVAAALAGLPDAELFIEYAQKLVDRDLPVFFGQQHVAWALGLDYLSLVEIASKPSYRTFSVAKRRGGHRQIAAPAPLLKEIQRYVQRRITSRLPMSESAHGFRAGRSIVTNARPHVGQDLVAKFDLADFFGTVTRGRVVRLLQGLEYSSPVVELFADLCTHHGSLPQGAPTSPDLANAAALEMDADLQALADEASLVYTRYADDLTFSGDNVRHMRHRNAVEAIVERHGFALNHSKSAVISQAGQQRVTGIVVNAKVNWPRDLRRWLRTEIYNVERFGVEEHLRRQADRRGPNLTSPAYRPWGSAEAHQPRAHYREFIYGHVYALNSARPDEATGYLERLDKVDWPGIPAGRRVMR